MDVVRRTINSHVNVIDYSSSSHPLEEKVHMMRIVKDWSHGVFTIRMSSDEVVMDRNKSDRRIPVGGAISRGSSSPKSGSAAG